MRSARKPDENLMIPQAEKKKPTQNPQKNPEKGRIEQAKEKEHTIATKNTDRHISEY